MEIHICEVCGNEHDGSYGSGRFCSNHCRHRYIGKQTKKHVCNFKAKKTSPYGTWTCYKCGEVFKTRKLMYEHKHKVHPHSGIWNKGMTTSTDDKVKQRSETIRNKIKSGEIIPHRKGKTLSSETKLKIRLKTIERIKTLKGGFRCNYNVKSIKYFDSISKQMGWNLQHAENGGEFYTGIGYWLDAYDKERNIAVEYDEPRHYDDVENNILKEHDL